MHKPVLWKCFYMDVATLHTGTASKTQQKLDLFTELVAHFPLLNNTKANEPEYWKQTIVSCIFQVVCN